MTPSWRGAAICLALLLRFVPAPADTPTEEAAVLIATAPPQQGSIPDIVTAYGSAEPALEGGEAISLSQEGRVAAILVTPGERVHRGDRLLNFDLSAAAVSAYAQAVSAADLARAERAHTAQLLAQRLATRDQLAQADKAVSDARATLDALTRQGGDRARTEITAGFDGVVDSIPVSVGDRVPAGAPLVRLIGLDARYGLDGLVVTVGIAPSDVPRVHPGAAAELHRLGSNTSLSGHVLRIDSIVNPKSHLVDADVGVSTALVLAGEAFAADITVGALAGWLVPHRAVLTDEKGAFLFQFAGGHARRVDVKVLGTRDDTDVVRGGVDAKLAVITDGATQLADGDPVRAAP